MRPSGTYSVRGRIVGYADYIATNVEVRADFTTDLNLELAPEAVQQAPVIVESTRPLIQKDATGTARFLSKDDIQNLPTRGGCPCVNALQDAIITNPESVPLERKQVLRPILGRHMPLDPTTAEGEYQA